MIPTEESKPNGGFRRAAGVVLLLAALVYSGWMMSHTLGGPFQRGFLGLNGARYSLMARNVLRCDLAAARFAPLLNMEGEKEPDPYLHHPPLLHWVIALVFHLFDESEDHARLVPFIFTLLNLILLYFLGRRIIGGGLAGGACTLAAAALPMTSFYGAHIDVQGSPLVFCMLACVLAYLRWSDTSKRSWFALALVALFAGTLFDWPALYLSLLLPLHYWLARRPSGERFMGALRRTWPFAALGFSLFALLTLWLALAGASKGTDLWGSLIVRTLKPETYIDVGDPWTFAWNMLLEKTLPGIHSLYPWPFLALLLLGWLLKKADQARAHRRTSITLWLFFLPGAIHMVLFPFGTLFHDYWAFLLMPWVALAASLSLVRLARVGRGRSRIERWAGPSLAALALLVSGHHHAMQRFSGPVEQEPYFLGVYIHEMAKPGEAVITNSLNYNAPVKGTAEDRYYFLRPNLSYYADRVVRGSIESPEAFEDVMRRRDDFTYFAFNLGLRNRHASLLKYLEERYPMARKLTGRLIFFRLK